MDSLSAELRNLAEDVELLYTVPRRAIEDLLVALRDERIGILGRNNGLVINERNGDTSEVIRLSIEDALRVGLRALADHLERT